MFSQSKWMFSLAVACLLAGLTLFLFPRRPDAKGGETSLAGESSESPPVANFKHNPASRIPAEDEWAIRWRELRAQPEGSERDKAMAALLEELAAIDPLRAISLAEAEPNPDRRVDFFQASLRGWGGANPEAAIEWAKSQTLLDEGLAMSAVFHGAARDPENALRLAAQLSAKDPGQAKDYGSYLIAALSRAGEFNHAAAFAADAPAEFRVDLLNAAYAGWGKRAPQEAMKTIEQLSDPETRKTAFDATISHWADNDSKAATEYASSLPAGREQTFALTVALRLWAATDPAGAATWMSQITPSPELDFGAAAIASQPDAIQQPEIAISWADSIVDPRLRQRVLATVVNQWAAIDPVAAQNYVQTSPSLQPDERTGMMAAFEPGFSPVSFLP